MKDFNIAVIAGDGIGPEVMEAATMVLDKAAEIHGGFRCHWREQPWSCEYYLKNGTMMPDNALDILKQHNAVYLGAVGYPGVPDHVSLWGMLLPIRRDFRLYVNLRPIQLLPGVKSPLADRTPEHIDFLVVRENNEGEYSNIGGRIHEGTPNETVIQNTVFTRMGVERIIRYAFELAKNTGRRRVTSATKSNGIKYIMPYWDEIFNEIGEQYPEIQRDQFHVDALAARFVTHPDHFEVVVASNLLGDILTDLGAAIAGSIGIAPSANLNPEGDYPSLFEPVHGSAPDITGKGIANPVGQIWSGAMMLEHLGFPDASEQIMSAVVDTIVDGIITPDLGGSAHTMDVANAIASKMREEA